MISVIIIDDEGGGRRLIREYLAHFPAFTIIDEAMNGMEAVQKINEHNPDLIFLDVQMPGMNGFEVLKHLNQIPAIIFSTAFDQYAISAFEVHAVDYLLKPYTQERFQRALNKMKLTDEVSSLGPFAESVVINPQQFPERILVNKNRRLVTIEVADILFVEAYGDYSKIHLMRESFVSNNGISTLTDRLNPASFLRVHRSYTLNLKQVETYKRAGKGYLAILSNGVEIRVSRGYAPAVRKIIV